MKRLLIVLCGLALSGCNSGPATVTEIAAIQRQCDVYGFRPGTDAYSSCMLQLDQNRIASATERRRAFGRALQQTGADMQAQQNRRISCTSSTFGTRTTTNCY
jgi:hypothetical protein